MSDKFAEGVGVLEDMVDNAVNHVMTYYELTEEECAKELERIAKGWRES